MSHGPERNRGTRRRPGRVEADILDLLRRAGLPPEAKPPTEEEISRTDMAAAQALARITESPRDPAASAVSRPESRVVAGLRPPGRPQVKRKLRLVTLGPVVTALVAVIVVAMLAQPWKDGADHSPAPKSPPSAMQANGFTPALAQFSLASYEGSDLEGASAGPKLEELARAAADQAPRGSGPVQHVRLDSWFLSQDAKAHAELVPTVTDRYYLANGQVRNIEYTGEPLNNAGRLTTTSPFPNEPSTDETFPGPEQGVNYAESLPAEPAGLIERLIPDQRECPVLAQCLTNQLLDLNYAWVVPPRVTSALWQALSEQTGITFLGTTVDRLNRPAVGFAVTTERGDRKLIVYADPDTGSVLGSEEVLLHQDETSEALNLELPAVTSFSALSASERMPRSELP
jgi:hypothetical protein